MKKTFRLFLVAMTAAALFLGCSTDDDDTGDDGADYETTELNSFLSKLPGVYTGQNIQYGREDGVGRAVKIKESNGTYTLEWWGCSGKDKSDKFITVTENFTANDLVKILPYESGYEEYGYRYYFRGKSRSKWEMGLTENNSVFYDYLGNSYTRRDSSFDFYAGTDKESLSLDDNDGSSNELPSGFDITASSWIYTGTTGNTSITYTVKFSANGTLSVTKGGNEQASGTWSLSGAKLTLSVKNNSNTTAEDTFTLASSGSDLTLTLSGESSYTTGGSASTTSNYSMALTVMFMANGKTATLTSGD